MFSRTSTASAMWLLPAFSAISRAGARIYYRLERAGGEIPARGPVLLIANHPNSLLDPALVAAAARRPVRFLAGSRTVAHPQIGWLIRAVESIPVYRRIDDPREVGKNLDTFRAATDALIAGSAIGIFPEGVSLDEPRLQPVKTGAARLALGAVGVCGVVPIIPVGLVYRERTRFRSGALIVIGRPIAWADLAAAGAESPESVRELTRRIESALRDVTVNLERWEDAPLIEGADAIWAAELGASPDPAHRVERLRHATEALARVRAAESERWMTLVDDVARHTRQLARLGLSPADLHDETSVAAAARWAARRLPLLALGAMFLSVGSAVFWVPYQLSGRLGSRTAPKDAAKSTHTVLYGAPVFALWIALLAVVAGIVAGWLVALAALIALPLWALATIGARDSWRQSWRDVRRFFTMRSRRTVIEDLRVRQRELAERLRVILDEVERAAASAPSTPAAVLRRQ